MLQAPGVAGVLLVAVLWLFGLQAQNAPGASASQSQTELDFHFTNSRPAFAPGRGPRVCVDAGHNNFQIPTRNPGVFQTFVDILGADGYRVNETAQQFSPALLAGCDVLVVADARALQHVKDPAFPHGPTLTRSELEALYQWLRDGGGLLLISDHTPTLGAMSDLGTMLGAVVIDGHAYLRLPQRLPEVFSKAEGTLRDHAILNGRDESENIDRVGTYQGSAFQVSREWSPLLVFGSESMAQVDLGYNFRGMPDEQMPQFSIGGWLLAGTRRVQKGRAVLLGEAGVCAAAVAGPRRRPMGMNHPDAARNAQFCLNTVRWLSGVLGD